MDAEYQKMVRRFSLYQWLLIAMQMLFVVGLFATLSLGPGGMMATVMALMSTVFTSLAMLAGNQVQLAKAVGERLAQARPAPLEPAGVPPEVR